MWVFLFILHVLHAYARNSSADNLIAASTNQTQLSTSSWPATPFKIPITARRGQDYGQLEITEIGQEGGMWRADAFASLVKYLKQRVPTGLESVTGFSVELRDEAYDVMMFDLTLDPIAPIPPEYLSNVLTDVNNLMLEHGFSDMEAYLEAPFGKGEFELRTDDTRTTEYKAPLFIDALGVDESFVEVISFDTKGQHSQAFLSRISAAVQRLKTLDQQALFQTIQLDVTSGNLVYHLQILPIDKPQYVDKLTNEVAYATLHAWLLFLLHAETKFNYLWAHHFEISTLELYHTEVVAKGQLWWTQAGVGQAANATNITVVSDDLGVNDNNGTVSTFETA